MGWRREGEEEGRRRGGGKRRRGGGDGEEEGKGKEGEGRGGGEVTSIHIRYSMSIASGCAHGVFVVFFNDI